MTVTRHREKAEMRRMASAWANQVVGPRKSMNRVVDAISQPFVAVLDTFSFIFPLKFYGLARIRISRGR